MNNQVVRQFLESFFLFNRVVPETFKREQSYLFSPRVLTVILDFRGAFEYHGIDDSIAGLHEWFGHFHVQEPYCVKYLIETSTRVYVKLDADIDVRDPIGGVVSSKAGQHYCSGFFEVEGDCIIRLELRFKRDPHAR